MNLIVIFLAVMVGDFLTDHFGFGFNVFSDPFDLTLLVINVITYIAIATCLDFALKKFKFHTKKL